MIDITEMRRFLHSSFPGWSKTQFEDKLREWEERECFPDQCLGVVENGIQYATVFYE